MTTRASFVKEEASTFNVKILKTEEKIIENYRFHYLRSFKLYVACVKGILRLYGYK